MYEVIMLYYIALGGFTVLEFLDYSTGYRYPFSAGDGVLASRLLELVA